MSGSWQHVVVVLAAVCAAAWLIRRRMKKKGCDDCALVEAVRKQPVRAAAAAGSGRAKGDASVGRTGETGNGGAA